MLRMIAFNMFAHGAFAGSIAWMDVNAVAAFGIGYSAWWLKLVVMQVMTREFELAGFDSRLVYVWIVLHGVVVATILLL